MYNLQVILFFYSTCNGNLRIENIFSLKITVMDVSFMPYYCLFFTFRVAAEIRSK